MNCEVIVSASGGGKIILQTEFPKLKFTDIPGFPVRYPEKGNMAISMLRQAPGILKAIRNEHAILNDLIETHHITHVISDNRYGLYSTKVPTAFITHQVQIMAGSALKFLEPVLNKISHTFIHRFHELWIPDWPLPDSLSGELSNTRHIKIPVKHLGILSRFTGIYNNPVKEYDIIALLSGPEPQRSKLEEKLISSLGGSPYKTLVVQGIPKNAFHEITGNLEIINAVSSQRLESLLHPETLLISRSGYSTLMDLVNLKHNRILFIPTPGQTEQEYIAKISKIKFGVPFIQQSDTLPDPGNIQQAHLPLSRPSQTGACLRSFLNKGMPVPYRKGLSG